jgi:hypothetical protein
MITNTTNLGSVPTPNTVPLRTPSARPAPQTVPTASDSLSTSNASRLQEALAQTPAIRPEVIKRVTPLATDPNYPSPEIMGRIGRLLTQSKDLSLQED